MKRKLLLVLIAMALGITPSYKVQAEGYDKHYEDNVEIITKEFKQEALMLGEDGEFETVYFQMEGDALGYRVQKGDCLSKIAKYFGLSVRGILELNPEIKNPDLIYIGQVIQLEETLEIVYD